MRAESSEIEKKAKLLEYQMIPEPKIRALWDRGTPSPVYILRRGNPTSFRPGSRRRSAGGADNGIFAIQSPSTMARRGEDRRRWRSPNG